jgi:hypothetical protein
MGQIVTDFTEKNDVRKMIFQLIFDDIFCSFTAFEHQKKPTSFLA